MLQNEAYLQDLGAVSERSTEDTAPSRVRSIVRTTIPAVHEQQGW